MNLGRHRRVTNEALREAFTGMGFADVATFRTSGNVAFAAPGLADGELAGVIESGLGQALGFAVPAFVRTAAEVEEIAAAEPFPPDTVAAGAGKLQVALMADVPAAEARTEVLSLAGTEDLLAFAGRELYWLPSGGILDSALDMKALAALLGPMTVRTKGTIELLAAKHFAG